MQGLAARQSYTCANYRFPPHVPLVPNDFFALDPQHASATEDSLHLIVVCVLDHRNAVPDYSHPASLKLSLSHRS